MRKILFTILTVAIGSLMLFSLTGCAGEDGAQGPAGPAGTNPPSPPIITAVIAAPDSIGTGGYTTIFVQAYDPNGDAMTYAWSATGGTLSSTNAPYITWTAPSELGLYQVSVTVSDADGSDDGSVTVGVNVYVPSVYPSYMGNNATRCAHCHEGHVEGWMETHHAEAYVAPGVTDNIYCIQCHTTGFDDTYDFAGNKLTTGLDNGGFDQNPVAALQGVQCEACHGPMGPEFSDHNPNVEMALTGMACDRCHSQNEEYAVSAHGTAIERAGGIEEFDTEFYRSTCQYCHVSESFISLWDEDWAGRPLPEEGYQVTCATCHDVHTPATEENPAYLRGLAAVTLEYGGPDNPEGFVIDDWGAGQLCVQCHHARRDLDNITGQIDNGSAHPGPHGSPQADMVSGVGCWEIEGYTYARESAHAPDVAIGESTLEDMCVKCHLYSIPHGEPDGPIYGHTFAPDVRACNTCHATPDEFDYHGRRTEIETLMTTLFNLLPNDGTEPLFTTDTTTREEREAAYAWFFVNNEGSMGVHNYTYAKSILENAIAYLNANSAN